MANVNELPSKILVIEDDQAQQALLGDVLGSKIDNLKLDFAGEGRQAMTLAQENQYDFIVLDWKLGGDLHGIGLLNHLRDNDKLMHIPVLVVSGYLQKEDFALMEEFPFTGFMEKPYKSALLMRKLKDLYTESMWYRSKQLAITEALSWFHEKPGSFMETMQAMMDGCPRPALLAVAAARALRSMGDSGRAMQLLLPLFKANPKSVMLMTELGKTYLMEGDAATAKTMLASAMSLSPNNLSRLLELGGVQLRELELEEAKMLFTKAKAMDPASKKAEDGLELAGSMGQYFQNTSPTSIPKTFAGLLNAVGISLVRQGEIEAGLKHYVSALSYVDSNLDRAKLAFNLALGYLRDVNPGEARVWFEKAMTLAPEYDKAKQYLDKLAKSTAADKGEDPFGFGDDGDDDEAEDLYESPLYTEF